jgi:sec-independent protein translocase protein TatC
VSAHTEMGLMEHLHELRKRLIISILAVLVLSCIGFYYSAQVFHLLSKPFFEAFEHGQLIGGAPAEAFLIRLKVSLFCGIVLAVPVLLVQVWLFIAPGLHAHERKLVIPFVTSATALFVLGVWFCYRYVLPVAFQFFEEQFTATGLTPNINISQHLSTTVTTLLAFGGTFEMPVLAYFMGRLGFIDYRTLIRGYRYAILIITVAAAVLSPPDVLSMCLLAVPLFGLYVLSIAVVWWAQPKTDLAP